MINKKRTSGSEVVSDTIIGDVKGKRAILVDDMIDTAGTLCNAAQAVIDAGATEVYAAATHGVLSGPAIDRLNNNPYKVGYKRIELSDVAAKTRTLDPRYIKDGCDIDPTFNDYLRPLLGDLPHVELLRTRS